MSIEAKLEALAVAVQANTEAIGALVTAWNGLKAQAQNLAAAGVPVADAPEVKVEKPKAEKPKAEKPAAEEKAPVEEVKPTPAPANNPTPADTEIIKSKLTQAVSQAVVRNRDGLIALLAAKGIQRATQLPETAWPAFIAEAEAL